MTSPWSPFPNLARTFYQASSSSDHYTTFQANHFVTSPIMHHYALASTSSLGLDPVKGASTRRTIDSALDTAPSAAPWSSSSSLESRSESVMTKQTSRSSLKSSLKSPKSAPTLGVRFSIPDPMPAMPGVERNALPTPRKDVSPLVARTTPRLPSRVPTGPPVAVPLRSKISNRFSEPAPVSRKDGRRISTPAKRAISRDYPIRPANLGSRVTSFQSVASAPAMLESTPSPAQTPPSQYNAIQHYIPCLFPDCESHYTPSLLGPTYYFAQQPYKLLRKKGLCPHHANQDLKLANKKAKQIWENMRQHAGRKTLGLIAAEFEIYLQQLREETSVESDDLEAKQSHKVLGGFSGCKAKDADAVGEGWNWHYSPRPCTRKGCGQQWYSPYDNRLFFFYHTPRPSSLVPLATLCPTCARADVRTAEERIEGRWVGRQAGPEWRQWLEEVKRDREMEQDFWEQAQERIVVQKMAANPVTFAPGVKKRESKLEKAKSKHVDKLKDICIVM